MAHMEDCNKKRKRAQQSARRTTKKVLNDIESRQLSAPENTNNPNDNVGFMIENNELVSVECDNISDARFVPQNNVNDQSDSEMLNIIDKLHKQWCTSSDDSDTEDVDRSLEFRKDLAQWATAGNIPHIQVTKLLGLLRKYNMDVPAQASTLLQTPRNVEVQKKSGGDYVYLGLKKGIDSALSSVPTDEIDVIQLSINVDGLPIYKSKNTSLWPIQCSIANILPTKPFVAAMYCSSHKPQDLDFLQDFVDELKELTHTGISIQGSPAKPVVIRCFLCDAPAKALVKGTKQYNGRYGCDHCDVRGEFDGRMLFCYTGNNRTDTSFRERTNPEHHKVDSPLLELKVDMIHQFPIDPMHCIDLGVTKKLMLLWKEGPLPTRLSAGQISIISTYHCSTSPYMPSIFNRKPRGLHELKMWKATEFRTFLMYTGPVILKYVLPSEMYKHFMCLSVAISILYNSKLVAKQKLYAHRLLTHFVEKGRDMYGKKFLSYNVHCMNHMADIAERYQCLGNCTAYPFENNMSSIKRSIRGTGNPIVQVSRRLAEMEHSRSPSPSFTEHKQPPRRGSCYRMKNGKFCTIHEVRIGRKQVLCEVYERTEYFYSSPCDSRIIGIRKVTKSNTEMQLCDFTDIDSIAINIPLSLFDREQTNTAVIIPLMHSL